MTQLFQNPKRTVTSASAAALAVLALCFPSLAGAVTYDVNQLGDAGDGTCDATCTLRDAIDDANASAAVPDVITFTTVAGTISPTSQLPDVTDPLTINGESAPGWAVGTPVIELEGSGAGAAHGLGFAAGSTPSTVQGLVINRFSAQGILTPVGGGTVTIRGNFIGTNLAGTAAGPGNGSHGVELNTPGNLVGGPAAADRNVISGNALNGVTVASNPFGGSTIRGNRIGTDHLGAAAVPNGGDGIAIAKCGNSNGIVRENLVSGNLGFGVRILPGAGPGVNPDQNLIGTDAAGTGALGNALGGLRIEADFTSEHDDVIAFNGGPGISVINGTNNTLHAFTFSNAGLGIDLGGAGVTPNDEGDGDSGPNDLQNFPVLTAAETFTGGAFIQGRLDTLPNSQYLIDFYLSSECDPSGHGEGQAAVGGTIVQSGSSGNVGFSAVIPASPAQPFVTTTARLNGGTTSEFSACRRIDTPLTPSNGDEVVARPASGTVRIKIPGADNFERLQLGNEIPVGSHIDATDGRVVLTTAAPNGEKQSASFYAGAFKVTQPDGTTLVTLRLEGGNFKRCPRRNSNRALLFSKPFAPREVVRKLWGRGHGRFQTRGRGGAATVRGTIWLTADRCDGTFFRVRRGVVDVRDFGRHRTVKVRAGQSYLARLR